MPVCKQCNHWYEDDEHDDYGNDAPRNICPQCLFDNNQTFEDPADGEIHVNDEFDDSEELEEFEDPEADFDTLCENDDEYEIMEEDEEMEEQEEDE